MLKRLQLMKRLAPTAAVAVVSSLLLTACGSKRDICAQHAAALNPSMEQLADFYRLLGIERSMPEGYNPMRSAIRKYCELYKS